MKLIKDLGKRKIGKYNRRFGLFYCEYCNRDVEKRHDSGLVYKSCGCLDRKEEFLKFETWRCTKCNVVKPLTEYYKNTTSFRRECKHCVKEKRLIDKFGVDYEWYKRKLNNQNSVCDICKTKLDSNTYDKLAVDHCHSTGKLRGLLCTQCNTSLGLLKENTETINNMLKYLTKYE